MAIIEIARIQVRRGQENTTGIPQLQPGEFGWAEDTQHLYIGKRITEGAYNDNNSRVLTEVDLPGILEGLRNSTTATQNTLYQYRSFTNTNYIRTHSHVRLLQDKLDETVLNFMDEESSLIEKSKRKTKQKSGGNLKNLLKPENTSSLE